MLHVHPWLGTLSPAPVQCTLHRLTLLFNLSITYIAPVGYCSTSPQPIQHPLWSSLYLRLQSARSTKLPWWSSLCLRQAEHAAPAPVAECIAPTSTECTQHQLPLLISLRLTPTVYAASAPVAEYVAPAPSSIRWHQLPLLNQFTARERQQYPSHVHAGVKFTRVCTMQVYDFTPEFI